MAYGDHQAGSGTQSDPWLWDDIRSKETASVWLAVTPEGADHLRWTYTLRNDSLSTAEATPGIDRFHMSGAFTPDVDDMTATVGWVPSVGSEYVNWQTPSELSGPYLTIGQTAVFTFRTPPMARVRGFGEVGLAGYPEMDSETGQYTLMTLPALRPMGIVDVPGVPLKAKLQAVTFSGAPTETFKVEPDPGSLEYGGPEQWYDQDANHIIDFTDDAGNPIDHAAPVGYVRGSTVKVSAKFVLTSVPPTAKTAFIRADGPGEYDLPWTVGTIDGGVLTLPETPLLKALKNKVDYIPDFRFKWEVCTSWFATDKSSAGESTNEMFVTLAKPTIAATDSMYITPLWLFCSGAIGTTNSADAIVKAYSPYTRHLVKTHKDLDPLRNPVVPKSNLPQSVPLHYYESWSVDNKTFATMSVDPTKDGQCQAWVDMFRLTLLEGGIANNIFSRGEIGLLAATGDGLMFVKDWNFALVDSGTIAPYKYVNLFNKLVSPNQWVFVDYAAVNAAGKWDYSCGANPEVTRGVGVEGQNTKNLSARFGRIILSEWATRFTIRVMAHHFLSLPQRESLRGTLLETHGRMLHSMQLGCPVRTLARKVNFVRE